MSSSLLIPRPKRAWEGHLVTFLAFAFLLHGVAYLWISRYIGRLSHEREKVVHINLLHEIQPREKPKPKSHPPKLKAPPAAKPKPAAPLLRVNQMKFHVEPKTSVKEPSNFQSVEEPKGGTTYGNPEGIPGGRGNINQPGILPPPRSLVPDRKNPSVLTRCQPIYPDLERDQGIEGTVGILVVVGRRGEITEARVSQSSGNSDLDAVALENVRQCWKFAPAIQNGQPVEARLTFSIVFRLQ